MKHKEFLIKILFLFLFIFIISCKSWKSNLARSGNIEAAAINAIIDFNKSKYGKFDTVFNLDIIHKDEFIGIGIISAPEKIYIIKTNKSNVLPTRYIEFEKKLYYWYDNNYPISEQVVQKLLQYKVIDSVETIADIDFVNDDARKSVNYFFCKDDLRKYKRIFTNKSLSSSLPREIICK